MSIPSSVYSGLGFYDNFGAKGLGGLAAGRLSLQRVQEMGEEGRAKMAETTKNYTKFNPVGLVSGKVETLKKNSHQNARKQFCRLAST